MNVHRKIYPVFVILLTFALLLSACGQPAAPTGAAMEVVKTVVVEQQGQQRVITSGAPAATEAPAAVGPQYALPTAAAQMPPAQPQAGAADPATGVGKEAQAPAGLPLPPVPNDPNLPQPLPTATMAPTPIIIPPQPTFPVGSEAVPGIVAPPPPLDNYFQYYGINPFVDTREDRLSTFALDVDTASYSVARRYVTDGNLPPVGSVRVEEYVNYFDPGYTPPANVAFALYADGSPSPFHSDGLQFLRVGVQGYQVSEAQRKPAALTFVIDTSGSMDLESRLGLVKASLRLLVERLRPTDTIAIVAYGSQAYVVLPPTSGEELGRIQAAIDSLYTTGSTNAEAGLRLGYQQAYAMLRPGAINRVILCSDGVANVGHTGPDAILNEIRGYVNSGITLTSVGFGMGNFNDVLMEQLADNGNGNYAYIDNIDEARKLFVEDLTGTLQVIAKDAKVQVEFDPNVVMYYRLIGYENRDVADQDFRNDTIDAGEIGAGHSAVALYAVYTRPGAQGRLATVNLRWAGPRPGYRPGDQRRLQHLGYVSQLRGRTGPLPVGCDRRPVRRSAAPEPLVGQYPL
jgi:Ca-activated chloride channel homolog